MSSSHLFAIMSLQGLEENYNKVCHNYLLYSAMSAIVSGKGSRCQKGKPFQTTACAIYSGRASSMRRRIMPMRGIKWPTTKTNRSALPI